MSPKRSQIIYTQFTNTAKTRRSAESYGNLLTPCCVDRVVSLVLHTNSGGTFYCTFCVSTSFRNTRTFKWLNNAVGWLYACVNCLSEDCLLVGCLTSQQHASVSQGRICSDNFTCCHTEKLQIKLATSPSHSILTPGRPVPALTL